MWLRYAVNTSGELVYIEQVKRGRTALQCPYCGGLLTAKKGQQVAPHFAHTGVTCRQMDRENNLDLPAYDNFNLHLPGKVLQALRDWDSDHWEHVHTLEHYGLVSHNDFVDSWQLTKKGQIPLGKLSLMLFCHFQEPLIMARYAELEAIATDVYNRPTLESVAAVNPQRTDFESYAAYDATLTVYYEARTRFTQIDGMDLDTALADLRIYRAQWRRILGLTLYFLDINDGQYHKIGVTSRPMAERLAEIKIDLLPLLGDVPIRVIDTFDHRGNVELYFKHRFADSAVQLGVLTEYFHFDKPKSIITELRRMKPKTLTDFERTVLSGQPADIERRIKRDQIEMKRRSAIVEGMARAQAKGRSIGRPVTDTEAFLLQYSVVADALTTGLSLRKTANETGVTMGTVRKVQRLLAKKQVDRE